jgi:predicted nucleotide-binding protein (sugar kinase/HSP70/actin superfamily)
VTEYDELLDEDLVVFAAKHYYTPKGYIDPEEFYDDLKRIKYIKRLVNRYLETGKLTERLLMNHIIVIFNVFGNYAGLVILTNKLDEKHWPIVKPFLEYLQYLKHGQLKHIKSNKEVEEKLKEI